MPTCKQISLKQAEFVLCTAPMYAFEPPACKTRQAPPSLNPLQARYLLPFEQLHTSPSLTHTSSSCARKYYYPGFTNENPRHREIKAEHFKAPQLIKMTGKWVSKLFRYLWSLRIIILLKVTQGVYGWPTTWTQISSVPLQHLNHKAISAFQFNTGQTWSACKLVTSGRNLLLHHIM